MQSMNRIHIYDNINIRHSELKKFRILCKEKFRKGKRNLISFDKYEEHKNDMELQEILCQHCYLSYEKIKRENNKPKIYNLEIKKYYKELLKNGGFIKIDYSNISIEHTPFFMVENSKKNIEISY